MTSPGNETPEANSGSGPASYPDASSGYEYPSLENSAPPADAASATNPVPPTTPTWETPGAPPSYPGAAPAYQPYPAAPPTYPSYPQYGQNYPPYPPSGQPGAYPPAGYPVAGGYPGYPAPGYADPYGYGAYGTPTGTNGLAIASLIASILGPFTCGLGSIAGLIMGFIALSQLKTSPQDGKGIAITGIIIGGVSILLGLLLMVIGIAADDGGSSSGSY